MYIVLFFSLLAVLLTALDCKGIVKNGISFGFILVTILGCIHYDYGNDYMSYFNSYIEITNLYDNLSEVIQNKREVYGEPGWIVLNYIFSYLGGFFSLVAFLNILMNLAYYKFIQSTVEGNWKILAVAIYLFCTNYYVLSFSMMRQSLVIAVFLACWPLIRDKRWFPTLCILILCSTIHSSALFLLPFAFLGIFNMKRTKIWVLAFVAIYVFLMINGELLNDLLKFAVGNTSNDKLDSYVLENEKAKKYGLGFLLNSIPLVISLYYLVKSNESDKKQIVMLSIISCVIVPFAQVLQVVGRFGMYFGAYSIAAIPISYSSIPNKLIRTGCIAIYVLMLLYGYYLFFSSAVYRDYYTDFHTIFDAL